MTKAHNAGGLSEREGIAMTVDLEHSGSGVQRTRRNIMKMGVILASSAAARANSAHAVNLSVVCNTPAARHFACNCFLKGTRIETAEGERRVEDLALSDEPPTMFGG